MARLGPWTVRVQELRSEDLEDEELPLTRPIVVSATAERSFQDVAWIVDRHADEFFGYATDVAAEVATRLVAGSVDEVAHFDRHARPVVEIHGMSQPRSDQLALVVGWAGDPDRRFLPNVEAAVLFSPVPGRRATRVDVTAEYSPSSTTNRHSLAPFVRRVVKATLTELLERLVEQLEDYEESAFT